MPLTAIPENRHTMGNEIDFQQCSKGRIDTSPPSARPKGVAVEFFYATWCGHCHAFAPVLCDLATRAPPGLTVRAWEADKGAAACAAAGIAVRAFPTVYLVDDAGYRHEYSGPRTAEALLSAVAPYLSAAAATAAAAPRPTRLSGGGGSSSPTRRQQHVLGTRRSARILRGGDAAPTMVAPMAVATTSPPRRRRRSPRRSTR